MDVFTVIAPVFATNCSVVAVPTALPAAGSGAGPRDCVVVDAGAGVADEVVRVVEQEGLTVRAVLATHGHVDHTWDAAELCERFAVPLWLHAADVYRIADPFGSIEPAVPGAAPGALVSGPLGQALAAAGARPQDYRAPDDVRELAATSEAVRVHRFGDVVLGALHAPGHTQGSTLYLAGDSLTPAEDGVAPADLTARPGDVVLTGDVLFAGTIGRTDLPGGDGPTMARTLRGVVGRLDDAWRVLPGHGPASTMARERRTNPYLARDRGTRPPLG